MHYERHLNILNKNHLSFWLRRLKTTHELIAPMRDVSGDIVLTELPRMHETALDGPALMPSPKEYPASADGAALLLLRGRH